MKWVASSNPTPLKQKGCMNYAKLLLSGLCASTLLMTTGCTKEDTGDSSDNTSPTVTAPSTFRTSCGTVYKGREENPISRKDGDQVNLTYVGPNLLSMSTKKGETLVKLHGLGVPLESSKIEGSREVLRELLAEGDEYMYMAEPDCSAVMDNGQEGVIAHVFSAKGRSFSEVLLRRGFGQPNLDVCQGNLISSCYRALAEDSITPTPVPTPFIPPVYGPPGNVGDFLWKPISDSDGRLAIHTAPWGTTVRVNNETGRNQGGGNGFGSLARFKKQGCGYGSNVKVVVYDSTGAPILYGGKPFITIPNGCQRYRMRDGKLSPENK